MEDRMKIKKTIKKLRAAINRISKNPFYNDDMRNLSSVVKSRQWLRLHELESGGIQIHSECSNSYPEVTGYLVPTLIRYGERDLAIRCLEWLYCIQRTNGSYTSPDGESYIFDTGQVLRGLLSGLDIFPQGKESAIRAADYLCNQMIDSGKEGFITQYKGEIPESVQLYVLPPLYLASEVFKKPEYRERAENCFSYYKNQPDFLQIDELTHFLAYQLEALIDIGHQDLAIPVLNLLKKNQQQDGSIRGIGSKAWICTTGLAQLAICWYKIGDCEPADKALSWLDNHQEVSGGFVGSIGPGATYFPDVEISWAVKFYLDAHLLRVKSFFNHNSEIFPSIVDFDDGRLKVLLEHIQNNDIILEVGCGKGRFLRAIKESLPNTNCHGIDISESLLSSVPKNIKIKEGSLENIPYPSNLFDVVFSVEAIEHSSNPEAAIREMVRVTKPSGWIIIIDKQQSHWGRLNCLSWERWPNKEHVQRLFNKWCDNVSAKSIPYERHTPDGLMVAWIGKKRSSLSGEDWTKILISSSSKTDILQRIQQNKLSPWGQEILLSTVYGEKVLEIGCGTGEISLFLAHSGRNVTVLDISQENLNFIQNCAKEIPVTLVTVNADAKYNLPFDENEFDCVWNSGLLEHFSSDIRRAMLKEFARVSKKKVIILVPNASCLAYHIGKENLEKEGKWQYGYEKPIQSLREDFEAADIQLKKEFSIGIKHAYHFLPVQHPLRKYLEGWLDDKKDNEMKKYNQGYLLIAIGTIKGKDNECSCGRP